MTVLLVVIKILHKKPVILHKIFIYLYYQTKQLTKRKTHMFKEYIKNLINEKRPGFLQKYANTDDVIKLYEPEILSVLDDIANCVIEYVEKRS